MADELKYVLLKGRALLGIAGDGRLTITMCNAAGVPYPDIDPIIFSNIPGKKAEPNPDYPPATGPDGTLINPPIKFLEMKMLARFSKSDFTHYKSLWPHLDDLLTWETAIDIPPHGASVADMNPTGPPPTPTP